MQKHNKRQQGHFAPQDPFWTEQKIEYAKSVIMNKVSGDLLRSMKKMEKKPKRNQFLSIGITVNGKATPITYYTEKETRRKGQVFKWYT